MSADMASAKRRSLRLQPFDHGLAPMPHHFTGNVRVKLVIIGRLLRGKHRTKCPLALAR